LEQCNDRAALVIESWKDWRGRGRMGLSFYRYAFDIEEMVGEKMVSFNFGGAWWVCKSRPGCRYLALGLPCHGC